MTQHDDALWHGDYKIPWHEPDFSRRMLAEHLSQTHDLASRRVEWIDRQVAWLHERLLGGRPVRVLDLGCGPGFYSHRLAERGHRCRGIDFGPASIEYASAHCPTDAACEFELGDIRTAALGGPYDLAMILYGELNVFAPQEAAAILRRVCESLAPGGRVVLEVQTAAAIEAIGRSEDSEATFDSGLFGDAPYHCRIENRWHAGPKVTVQTFAVTMLDTPEQACCTATATTSSNNVKPSGATANGTASNDGPKSEGPTRIYRSTTQAWSDDALAALLRDAGFVDAKRIATACDVMASGASADESQGDESQADDTQARIAEAWPCNTDVLALWIATRGEN